MDSDEILIFLILMLTIMVAVYLTSTTPLHKLYLEKNPAIGLVRLTIGLAMAAIIFSVVYLSDESVVGVYVAFYIVMGYALTKVCGQIGAEIFGVRFKIDVCQRRNLPAAVFLSGFVLATGLVFAGSIYGEADPYSSDEGGWWIPLGFFILGWLVLLGAMALFFQREPDVSRMRLRRERDQLSARAAAAYTISSGLVIANAVGGDFYGWIHGVGHVGIILAMLVGHELFRMAKHQVLKNRVVESGFYILFGLLVSRGMNWLDSMVGLG